MGSDLFSIVNDCRRVISVVNAVGEQCEWIQSNIDFPHIGSETDYDKMLNLVVDAVEVTQMADQLRASLDSYLQPYNHDYSRLGLNAGQVATVEMFLEMTNIRPLGTFESLYTELGCPPRVTPPANMPGQQSGVTT